MLQDRIMEEQQQNTSDWVSVTTLLKEKFLWLPAPQIPLPRFQESCPIPLSMLQNSSCEHPHPSPSCHAQERLPRSIIAGVSSTDACVRQSKRRARLLYLRYLLPLSYDFRVELTELQTGLLKLDLGCC